MRNFAVYFGIGKEFVVRNFNALDKKCAVHACNCLKKTEVICALIKNVLEILLCLPWDQGLLGRSWVRTAPPPPSGRRSRGSTCCRASYYSLTAKISSYILKCTVPLYNS
jgi:hypothetical protein